MNGADLSVSLTPERRAEINQQKVLRSKAEVIDKKESPLEDIQAREYATLANRRALLELMERYNVTIGQKAFDKWRPTVPTPGWINGLPSLGELMCVATDGMLGLFVNGDDVANMYHVQEFQWIEAVTSMIPYLKPSGEVGYFKQITEKGAPGPLNKVYKPRPVKVSKPKKPTRAERLALL